MIFSGLIVIHRLKSAQKTISTEPAVPLGSYFLDSCQRRMWAFKLMEHNWVQFYSRLQQRNMLLDQGWQCWEGAEAYGFLLRVATGLESQMVGETEVLGQIKEAWNHCQVYNQDVGTSQAQALSSVMRTLFEDAKEVRSRFLRNLGCNSYGSMVRKFLQEHAITGRILVVGAGQLAQSLVPWLADHNVVFTNRSAERLQQLASTAQGRTQSWSQSWDGFDHIILCVPGTAEVSQKILQWQQSHAQGVIVDLGEPPTKIQATLSLADIFERMKQDEEKRAQEVARARSFCDEKAAQRELTATLTIPFGWEDICVFS